MATITAGLVKELRESTGAGMMDCKQALTETAGDMQAAQDWLRKKGLSKNRLYNLIDQGLNGMISFTHVPMRLCLLLGFLISGCSILYALLSFAWHLIASGPVAPPGIPTLIVALFFFRNPFSACVGFPSASYAALTGGPLTSSSRSASRSGICGR